MDTKKISAEQARAYQKQLRLEQFRNRAETGTLPLQPAEPVDAFIQPGNLATKDILRDGFELRIPEWTRIAGDDDVILFINNVEVFDNPIYSVPETYIPGSYTPVIYPVPSFYLGGYKGTITLKYHVLSGSGQRDVSEPLEIEIDQSIVIRCQALCGQRHNYRAVRADPMSKSVFPALCHRQAMHTYSWLFHNHGVSVK